MEQIKNEEFLNPLKGKAAAVGTGNEVEEKKQHLTQTPGFSSILQGPAFNDLILLNYNTPGIIALDEVTGLGTATGKHVKVKLPEFLTDKGLGSITSLLMLKIAERFTNDPHHKLRVRFSLSKYATECKAQSLSTFRKQIEKSLNEIWGSQFSFLDERGIAANMRDARLISSKPTILTGFIDVSLTNEFAAYLLASKAGPLPSILFQQDQKRNPNTVSIIYYLCYLFWINNSPESYITVSVQSLLNVCRSIPAYDLFFKSQKNDVQQVDDNEQKPTKLIKRDHHFQRRIIAPLLRDIKPLRGHVKILFKTPEGKYIPRNQVEKLPYDQFITLRCDFMWPNFPRLEQPTQAKRIATKKRAAKKKAK